MKNISRVVIIFILSLFVSAPVYAGFGITPPYVQNSSLTRNSIYEQDILIVRSDPNVPLTAEIIFDVPGITDWFTIDKGTEFLLPQGEEKVPMKISVTVPDDADFKQYTGNIQIRTRAADVSAGSVSISLGAQIDVDLNVIDKEIRDFRVRKISINDLNEGHKLGWLYFPGKIRFDMFIENTGNVPVAPSTVAFRLYDVTGKILLEETEHTNRIQKIAPFATETVTAELPTRLPTGNYIARYEIFNGEEVKQTGEINLNVLPYGTLQTAGYGFMGLSLAHKASVLLPLFVVLGSISIFLARKYDVGMPRRSPRKRKQITDE